jgi:phage tail-like protein
VTATTIKRPAGHAAFRFVVDIGGSKQAAFTECTLPDIELETEELREGGENTHTLFLLGQRKAARITLKHGVGKSELLAWYLDILNEKFSRKSLTIEMLSVDRKPVMSWDIADAIPVKWSGPQLQSDANSIAIQSLELACGKITVKPA